MNGSSTKRATPPETTLGQDVVALVRHWLRGWRGWLTLGFVAAAAGLWLGWPSLVAAGIAPILLGVLPCVAMCALGMCMKGGARSSDSEQTTGTNEGVSSGVQQNRRDERKETDR